MKSFKELMEIVAPDVKTEMKNTFESAEEKVPEPSREAVGGRFTSRPPKSVIRPAPQVASEEVEQIEEKSDEAYNHYKKQVLPIYKKHGLSPEFAKAVNNHVAKHGSYQVWNHHGDADGQNPHWFDSEKQKVKPIKQKRGYEVSEEVVAEAIVGKPKYSEPNQSGRGLQYMNEDIKRIEEMDKSQTPPGRDGGYQFAPGPKVSKKDIEAVKKNPAKHLSDLFAKEYAKKKMKEEVEQIEEGRPSQRHPLEGHEYHKKTDAELVYIAKDAHKAAEAMKSHNTTAENKYRDQANDSATVRYFRQKNGMPDWYKKKYGHMKEEVEQIDEAKDPKEYGYEGDMAMNQLQTIMRHAEYLMDMMKPDTDLPEWVQSKITLATDYLQTSCDYMTSEMKEAVEPPFTPNKPKTSALPGKAGKGYSTARHLARMAMQKQVDKLKKPVKESIEESRKAEIVKDIVKKKKAASEDTFQKDPELSSSLTKTQ